MSTVLAEGYWRMLKTLQDNQAVEVTKISAKVPFCDINLNKREIILPEEYKTFLSVQKDSFADTIYFKVPRFYDDVDLARTTIIIEYVTPADTKNGIPSKARIYPAILQDWTSYPGYILFGWSLGREATQVVGPLKFAVRFYRVDPEQHIFTYSLNTLPATGNIVEGIGSNINTSENYDYSAEVIDVLMQQITDNRPRWVDV